jgi:hypothetical protein
LTTITLRYSVVYNLRRINEKTTHASSWLGDSYIGNSMGDAATAWMGQYI